MSMLKNANSMVVAIIIISCLIGLRVAGYNLTHSEAQETERTLQNLLNSIDMNYVTLVTRFATPIAGDTQYWIIPEDVTVDDLTMRRTLYEVGSDYFCVQESGQGARDVKCIPFSNIAEITYTRTD